METYSFTTPPKKRFPLLGIFLLLIVIGLLLSSSSLLTAPEDFPTPYTLTIESGQTLFSLSDELFTDHAIASKRVFELLMISLGSEHRIVEGDYYFEKPVGVIDLALRISGKQFGINRTKVTFPEGFNNREMALRLGSTFPGFDTVLFSKLAADSEGYLFPDTYSFFASVTPDVVIHAMQQTFTTKTADLYQETLQNHQSWDDIIIMASIIEKEAAGDNDRKLISGILWERIERGMPLQVDAPFLYILGKKSSELTHHDLATSSSYNTYLHKGLPPTPIGNPGLAAIDAALHPTNSEYVYYLHDSTGAIHYASTYSEHQKNITRYLK